MHASTRMSSSEFTYCGRLPRETAEQAPGVQLTYHQNQGIRLREAMDVVRDKSKLFNYLLLLLCARVNLAVN